MRYRDITAAFAAMTLVAVPTLASAAPVAAQNPASALSLSSTDRAATATKGKSKLSRGGIIGVVLALGVVAGGIIAISKDDNPASR